MSEIQVIDRAVDLLDALARSTHSARLKILSADTGLHPSTAFRILGSLVEHGLVDRDAAGEYRLGPRLLAWGERVHARIDLRSEARPIMEWLRDQIGETVNLTLREGDEVVYIERATAKQAIRVEQVIGSRAPLHVTAVGKLMLGELGDTAIHEYVARTGLKPYTKNTLATEAALLNEVHQATKNAYALDNEEAELGVGCMGVLLRNSSGGVVAGLSVSAPIERRKLEWVELIKSASEQISQRLGYLA